MIPVVITGRGLVTPIGMSLAENLESLKTGKNGITRVPFWQELNLDSQVAGVVTFPESHLCSVPFEGSTTGSSFEIVSWQSTQKP